MTPRRPAFPGPPAPRATAVEMEQEKVNGSKELSADATSYRCSACHGDEDWALGHPIRGRAKSRSLSASPALASTREFRRTRSLHGPCPVTTFGPKACVLQNPQSIMHIQDPASQRLTWNKSPKSVLVIKKVRDASLLQPFRELCTYLMEQNNMIVYVEKKVLEDPALVSDDHFGPMKRRFCTFREDYDDISNQIDLIICLGGDGTLLYASSLFQGSVPPVMAFHLGSLGFLTPFNFENFQSQVTQVIQGNAAIVLRSRLKVRVVKELCGKKLAVPNGVSEHGVLATALDAELGKQVMQYQVCPGPSPPAPRAGRPALQPLSAPASPPGAERGGDRQRPLLVPVQRGCLPGRAPHHHGAGRWRHRLHPDGQHGVCSRRRGLHDSPQRASHHGHTHLPPLAVLPAYCGPCRGRAEDHAVTRSKEYRVGVLRWTKETGDPPRRQHQHHHLLLPAPLRLRPRPRERLV
uniref:NAD(+) kinase n=1 Tax=Sus scrofa TaxID=9823 RepID=A0A8D1UKN3_PIG